MLGEGERVLGAGGRMLEGGGGEKLRGNEPSEFGVPIAGRVRIGGGGGVPGGRVGGPSGATPGRGGRDTWRGSWTTGLEVGFDGTGSALVGARFSLSLADPCSSPMEALCWRGASIAQIAFSLSAREPSGINAS
jgi:hypothetical protein